jgi:hypothetical protein
MPATTDRPAPRRPTDAHAFLAEAERLTNAHDAIGAAAIYAADAVLELVTDGAREDHRGAAAIRRAWQVTLGAGARRGFRVRKTLVAADDDVIVNRWEGTIGRSDRVRGMESWRFDDSGRVVEHHAWTFLDVRPATGLVARLRLAATAPRTAVAFLRAERAAA